MHGPAQDHEDRRWMRAALSLAARGLGNVAPNPAVGCVITRDGAPVGRGWTQPGGRPHAETEALRRAGEAARGATAYVTLEPCSHHGQTGPCADAMIAAGVARCVVAMTDPDPRVSGRGLARMREAGIAVETGVEEDAAQALNRGFVLHRTEGRPMVTLKTATTLDGRIATGAGESKWITGPEARADAHLRRMTHDAVLVGIGTAVADDPSLTCRLPGIARQPTRVVLDGDGRLPMDAALRDGAAPLLWIVGEGRGASSSSGVTVLETPRDGSGKLDPIAVLAALAEHDVTRLLIEGGGRVAAAFLAADAVDRVVWYKAGLTVGAHGVPAVAALPDGPLADLRRYRLAETRTLGPDTAETWIR